MSSTPQVLESIEKFEARIQIISATSNRCDKQIQELKEKLHSANANFESAKDLKKKRSGFKRVVHRLNHIGTKLRRLRSAYKKLSNILKNTAVSAAKTTYLASIPLAITTAVIMPEQVGAFLTVMEKIKATVVSDGSYADKLATLDQLIGSLGESTSGELCDNDPTCLAVDTNKRKEAVFNIARKEINSSTPSIAEQQIVSDKTKPTANPVATATKKVASSKGISAEKGSGLGKAATEAKIAIAGKTVPIANIREASSVDSAKSTTVANVKVPSKDSTSTTTSIKVTTNTKGTTHADESTADDLYHPANLANIVQSNPTSTTNAKPDNPIDIVQINPASPPTTPTAPSSITTPDTPTPSVDSSNTLIIINTDSDNVKAVQTGNNNYIQITQPGGQNSNIVQDGSLNRAVITQNQ